MHTSQTYPRLMSAAMTLLLSLALSGCLGIDQPMDYQIEDLSKSHFNQQMNGLFTATKVVKVNGYQEDKNHYIAHVIITGKAIQSLDEYASGIMDNNALSPFEKMANGMMVGLLKLTVAEFEAGDEREFERHYLFIKTDNGWQLKREVSEE
ncbi:MAG: hypothetical protein GXO35_05395 [Gammaproteobacteria bacterium]|nr:hypothetical protein [Gammaproteobacteria bacterium]